MSGIEKKMLVTDLDGTLLKNDKSISEYTSKVIKEARRNGHKFVIATARPIRAAQKFLQNIEVDAAIYHNGALIYIDEKKFDGFQIDDAKEVIDRILLEVPYASIAVEVEDMLYSNFDAERLWPGTDFVYTYSNFNEVIGKKADKIIVEVSSLKDMYRYEKYLPEELYIQLSENKIGMIMNREASKSNGIKLLAKRLNIDIDNIVAFGDDYNDIDMIKLCGIGVCVKNAVEDLKEVTNFICDTNENDGVAKWIENYII